MFPAQPLCCANDPQGPVPPVEKPYSIIRIDERKHCKAAPIARVNMLHSMRSILLLKLNTDTTRR